MSVLRYFERPECLLCINELKCRRCGAKLVRRVLGYPDPFVPAPDWCPNCKLKWFEQ